MNFTKHHIDQIMKARDSYSFYRTFLEHRTNPKINLDKPVIENGDYESTLPFLLWYATFNYDKTILCGFPTYAMAKHAYVRAKEIYEALPEWMAHDSQPDHFNDLSIRLGNGSRIVFQVITEKFGRGHTVNKLYLYEYGMVNPKVRASVYPWWMCHPFLE